MPPDVLAAMSNHGAGSNPDEDGNSSTTPPGSSPLFSGMNAGGAGGGNAPNSGFPGFPGGNSPSAFPGQPAPTINLHESLNLLDPVQAFNAAWHQSVMGEKTEKQKQVEQSWEQKLAVRIDTARQDWESYKQMRKMEEKRRIDLSLQMKSQLMGMAPHLAGSSVSLSTTTQGDLSEIQLLEKALQDAQQAQRQAQAQAQMRAQQKRAPRKGPQLDGAEGGEQAVSMMDRMVSGNETKHSAKQDTDALQRQSEQALGE